MRGDIFGQHKQAFAVIAHKGLFVHDRRTHRCIIIARPLYATQLVNFFHLAEGKRLVDLPGYGFAKVAEAIRAHWGELLQTYFEERQSLQGLFLIVDIRRGITDFDEQMLALAGSADLPVHILLTKADKLKRGPAINTLLRVRKEIGKAASVQLFSALSRQGAEEARETLAKFLEGSARTPAGT